MKKRNLLLSTLLTFAAISIGIILHPSSANAADSGQALEIAPPVMSVSADPGQTITKNIDLRNISSGSLIVTNQINDFIASGEDGTPKVILDSSETSPYSIKDWITAVPELSIKSKQIEHLPITITVPKNASPGGYYGVIRFTATPADLKTTGVSLSASLGALVLLKVNGVAKENLSIEELSVNRNGATYPIYETTPLQFVVRLKNDGNIHEQPSGQIKITDMFGKEIAAVNVNLAGSSILPQSIRRFEQPLDKTQLGDRMLFGRYTAELKITYGADKQVITKSITFWVIPYTLILVIIAGAVASFFGLRYGIKRYNNYIRGQVARPSSKRKK